MHPAPIGLALIASLASPQDSAQQPNRLNIKVVLATRVQFVQRDENGGVAVRRGFMEPSQLNEMTEAIKLATEAIKTSSGGKVEVTYHSLVDPDPYYVWFDPTRIWVNDLAKAQPRTGETDVQLTGRAMADEVVAPWLNEQGFTNQVSPNYGPFNAAVLVHAGLTNERTDLKIHSTPVRVMSWNGFAQGEPIASMAQELASMAAEQAGIPSPQIPNTNEDGAIGEFTTATFNDPTVGSGQRITSRGIVARGGVVIQTGEGQSGFLNLKVRTKSNVPFAIVGRGRGGELTGAALLGDPTIKPLEAAPVPTTHYPVPPDNKWHSLSIPLAELGGNPLQILVAMHPYAANVEYSFKSSPIIEVAGIEFKPTAASDAIAKVDGTMISTETVGSDPAALTAGLSSSNYTVRLASAWRLGEVKAPEAVTQLKVMAKSANALEAMAAIPALAFQDTEEAWAEVRNQLFVGPFDPNRRFAAQCMAGRLVTSDVVAITPALAVRSWRTRAAVLDAVIPVVSRETSFTLSGSLDDPFPQIRQRVVSNIGLSENILLRRLIFTAVNDPSQYVRAVTFVRLLDVEDEAIRSDALKGVRDDALGVRLAILTAMREHPQPHYRSALRVAVTDSSPLVRAAALEALLVQSDTIDPAEISNTFSDSDEGVQLVLVKLAKSGQVTLPTQVIQSLKESAHASVREAAKDLGLSPFRA